MGAGQSAMPGMSMGTAHASGLSILPEWLALIWTAVFVSIAVSHCRHLLATRGQLRVWHSGHVLMAVGMVFMYAPAAVEPLTITPDAWQLTFSLAVGSSLVWVLAQLLDRLPINVLWVLMGVDLAAMLYMWVPGAFSATLSWLLVAYFAVQACLWATGSYRRVDGLWRVVSRPVASVQGTIAISLAAVRSQPLICDLELRPSMTAMAAGMAYMLAAMALVH
jgi:Domain of unknown function (DUF5134)